MRLGVALLALLCLTPSLPVRAEPVRYSLRAELGAEYDSNPGRIEHIVDATQPRFAPIVGSAVGRLVLSGDLALPIGDLHSLSLSGTAGGKRFLRSEARAEDAIVDEATAAWNVRAGDRTTVALVVAHSDVFQRRGREARDYSSTAPSLRLEQGVGEGGVLTAGAGYRWFAYGPDAEFDFQGPSAYALYRHFIPGAPDGGADWDWSGGATAELRAFTGTRCLENTCPGPADAGARRDQFWTVHAQVTRTGSFLSGAGLALHGNASNSFGERLLRGLVHLRAVVLLPLQVSLSGRAELVVARYLDGLPLVRNVGTGVPDVNLESESRSTVRLELARPFGAHLDAGLRYTLYTNELGAPRVQYLRQTALVFVAVLAE
jgi:hypothetical protein